MEMLFRGMCQTTVEGVIYGMCIFMSIVSRGNLMLTSNFDNCSITKIIDSAQDDAMLVGCGNVAMELTSRLNVTNAFSIGARTFAAPDPHGMCYLLGNCRPNAINRITVLSRIPSSRSQLLICTIEGKGICDIVDTIHNRTTKLQIDDSKGTLLHTFSEKVSISTILLLPDHDGATDGSRDWAHSETNTSSLRLVVSTNTGAWTKAPYLNVFSFLRLNLTSNTLSFMFGTNTTSIFTVMSTYLSETVYAFVYKDFIYHIVLHLNHIFGSGHYGVIQTSLTSVGVTSIQAHLRCEQEFYRNVTAAVLLRNTTSDVVTLYTLHSSNDSSIIGKTSMDELEAFFKDARDQCERNSYVQWTMPNSRIIIPPCNAMDHSGVANSILLTDSAIITSVDSIPVGENGRDLSVYHHDDVVVAAVATASAIYKIKLGPNSQLLTSWPLQTEGSLQLRYQDGGTLYAASDHTITVLRPLECSSNLDMGSCVRDVTSCTWCNGTRPQCVQKHNCSSPITSYTGDVPMVTGTSPDFLSSCGRSMVTVTGSNLDQADNISIVIGTDKCIVKTVTNTFLKCRPLPLTEKTETELVVTINNDEDNVYRQRMVVGLPCPQITNLTPSSTIRSGGTKVTFTGNDLDNLPGDVTMYLRTPSGLTTGGPCESQQNTSVFVCITPPLRERDLPSVAEVLLLPALDGDDAAASFPSNYLTGSGLRDIQLLEDPMFKYFGTRFRLDGRVLTLKGKHLTNVATSEFSISIFKGGLCDVIDVTTTNIQCLSKDVNSTIDVNRHITIMIGDNLIYFPGFVSFGNSQKVYDSTTRFTHTDWDSSRDPTNASVDPPSPIPSVASAGNSASTVGYVLAVLALVVLVIAVVLWRRRKRKRNGGMSRDRPSIVSYNGSRVVIRGDGTSFNMPESSLMDSVSDVLDEPCRDLIKCLDECGMIIRRDCIKMADLIGKGNFGSVYKGYLSVAGRVTIVAIKTLHNNDSRSLDENQFLKEAFVMKDFRHENVMALMGICLDVDSMPLVIIPYMEHGDLLSYLHDDQHIPTVKDLVSFGLDIAEGMTYLANLKFVHRDLAARNCMLDANCRVKVADFGLSRDIYETSYYSTKHKGTKLPVKWMAIESIMNGVFNEKTDVWAYGITMWELMTRGVRPYATVDNWDMERFLNSGRRLPQPIYCPVNLYKVMRRCWSEEPENRPPFTDLRQCIRLMLDRAHHQLAGAEQTNIASTYVNIEDRERYVYENEETF